MPALNTTPYYTSFENNFMEETCPECNSDEIILDPKRGEKVCSNCGMVISHHMIDTTREGRRAFSMEEKLKRDQTGSPISSLLPDLGLTTVIDTSFPLTTRMRRIIKWNSRMSWDNRNMLIATTEIKRIGGHLTLPQRVKENAAKIYKKAFKHKLLRGRSIKAMVIAALYYACRQEKIPRTFTEIIEHTDVEPREVRRCYRTLIKELKLKVPTLDPVILVPKYIANLEMDNDVEKTTINLIKLYRRKYPIAGKDPKGLVAAAIYIASLLHKKSLSQSRIAKNIGITEVTLRSRYKELSKLIKFQVE